MKKVFLALIILFTIQQITFAQVTKSDIQNLLVMNNTSMEKIEKFYIGNQKTFYTDGSWKRTSSTYNKSHNNYINEFILADNGIMIKSIKDGKDISGVTFYPLSSLISVYVEEGKINIYLKE